MRTFWLAAALCSVLSSERGWAQKPPRPMDLTGTWAFTWDGDPKNVNEGALEQGAGTFTGVYINDAKDRCPLAGRQTSPGAIALTIVCPKWEIRAEGTETGAGFMAGRYVAYGTSEGTFQMRKR